MSTADTAAGLRADAEHIRDNASRPDCTDTAAALRYAEALEQQADRIERGALHVDRVTITIDSSGYGIQAHAGPSVIAEQSHEIDAGTSLSRSGADLFVTTPVPLATALNAIELQLIDVALALIPDRNGATTEAA